MSARRAAALLTLLMSAVPAHGVAAAPGGRTDPMRSAQWGLNRIGAPGAWAASRGSGVVVAVLDTGVDLTHPDLRNRLVRGANFVSPQRSPHDDHGHGTHVAGVIAATTDNGIGISGVAPDARVMPVKVLNAAGNGTAEAIAAGIRFAADRGARVINLSLGGNAVYDNLGEVTGSTDAIDAAVQHAWGKGAVIIAAAGNSSVPLCSAPAVLANVVCVGAVGPDDVRAWYSQSDATPTKWYLCGPGGAGLSVQPSISVGSADDDRTNVLSTVARGTSSDRRRTGYVSMAGTSMAAPHVAGVAALLAAQRLTNKQVVDRLLATAEDIDAAGRDPVCGHGLVNAAAAVRAAR